MKLVTRRHRILAVFMGIALLVVLVIQILRDGNALELKDVTKIQTNKK